MENKALIDQRNAGLSVKLQRAFIEKHTLLGEIHKLKQALRKVVKDHHAGIDTSLSEELSRNLSGHFRASTPPAHLVTENGTPHSLHAVSQSHSSQEQQQDQDQHLEILLNESIRSATRTCLWVFRCQITKTLAKAFHIWSRHTSTLPIGRTQRLPAATRPLPTAAERTIPPQSTQSHTHTDRDGLNESPIPLVTQCLSPSKSTNFSDLSDSDHDQAVQDLLNSSIASAADSLHDEKRSLLLSAAKSIMESTSPERDYERGRANRGRGVRDRYGGGRDSITTALFPESIKGTKDSSPQQQRYTQRNGLHHHHDNHQQAPQQNPQDETIDTGVRLAQLRVKEYYRTLKAQRSLSMDLSRSKEIDPNEIDPYDPLSPPPQQYQRDIKRNYMSNTMVLPKPKPLPAASPSPPPRPPLNLSQPPVNKNRKDVRVPSVHDIHEDIEVLHKDILDKKHQRRESIGHYSELYEEEVRGRSLYRDVHRTRGQRSGGDGRKKGDPHGAQRGRTSASPGNKASPIRKQDSISPETVFRNHTTLRKVTRASLSPHATTVQSQPGYDKDILNSRTRSRHNSFSFEDITPSGGVKDDRGRAGGRERVQSVSQSVAQSVSQSVTQSVEEVDHEQLHHHQPMREDRERDDNISSDRDSRRHSDRHGNLPASTTSLHSEEAPPAQTPSSPQPSRRPPVSPRHAPSSGRSPMRDTIRGDRRSRSADAPSLSGAASQSSRSLSVGAGRRGSAEDQSRARRNSSGVAMSRADRQGDGTRYNNPNPDLMYQYSETDEPSPETNDHKVHPNSGGNVEQNRASPGGNSTEDGSYHQSNRSIYDILKEEYRDRRAKMMPKGDIEQLDFEFEALNGLSRDRERRRAGRRSSGGKSVGLDASHSHRRDANGQPRQRHSENGMMSSMNNDPLHSNGSHHHSDRKNKSKSKLRGQSMESPYFQDYQDLRAHHQSRSEEQYRPKPPQISHRESSYHPANVRHTARQQLAERLLQQEDAQQQDWDQRSYQSHGKAFLRSNSHGRNHESNNNTLSDSDDFGIKHYRQGQQESFARQHTPAQNSVRGQTGHVSIGAQNVSQHHPQSHYQLRHSTSDIPPALSSGLPLQRQSMSALTESKYSRNTNTSRSRNNNGNSSISSKIKYQYLPKPMSKAQYQLIYGPLDDGRGRKNTDVHRSRTSRR